ncbi:carbonic anhydrase 9-like isoform X2 [Harmonia axyridis]|uniref:carbonic anhydrase 9-like isoform X2 n=1 Tax=Harmonia axyridis TaxID=115357 RepID=UPI001E278CC2|nr:carbonic anhydrase 9-like isoform X2 [Harmonia axyridis]
MKPSRELAPQPDDLVGDSSSEAPRIPLSPLDLYTHKAKLVQNEPIQFVGFNTEFFPEIVNNGYTIQINSRGDQRPRITGGGLRYPEYMVQNVHFHWDSEHTINSVRFMLECHIQLVASEFKTFKEAAERKGLAILASVWRYSEVENPSLNTVLAAHDSISRNPKIPCLAELPIVISQLIPDNTANYFRYEGSITFPPFYPNTYTVFVDRAHLTRKQLYVLSDIYNEIGNPVVYNNLPTIRSKMAPPVFFNGDKNSCYCLKFP